MRATILAFALAATTLPAAAQDKPEREAYDCETLRACVVGQPCHDDGTVVELVFRSWTEAQITFGGIGPYDLALHPELRTGAWRMGDVTVQFALTGDGSATLTTIPLTEGPEATQVLFLHCSPH